MSYGFKMVGASRFERLTTRTPISLVIISSPSHPVKHQMPSKGLMNRTPSTTELWEKSSLKIAGIWFILAVAQISESQKEN